VAGRSVARLFILCLAPPLSPRSPLVCTDALSLVQVRSGVVGVVTEIYGGKDLETLLAYNRTALTVANGMEYPKNMATREDTGRLLDGIEVDAKR